MYNSYRINAYIVFVPIDRTGALSPVCFWFAYRKPLSPLPHHWLKPWQTRHDSATPLAKAMTNQTWLYTFFFGCILSLFTKLTSRWHGNLVKWPKKCSPTEIILFFRPGVKMLVSECNSDKEPTRCPSRVHTTIPKGCSLVVRVKSNIQLALW